MSEYPASGKRDSAVDEDNFLLMDSRCVLISIERILLFCIERIFFPRETFLLLDSRYVLVGFLKFAAGLV